MLLDVSFVQHMMLASWITWGYCCLSLDGLYTYHDFGILVVHHRSSPWNIAMATQPVIFFRCTYSGAALVLRPLRWEAFGPTEHSAGWNLETTRRRRGCASLVWTTSCLVADDIVLFLKFVFLRRLVHTDWWTLSPCLQSTRAVYGIPIFQYGLPSPQLLMCPQICWITQMRRFATR